MIAIALMLIAQTSTIATNKLGAPLGFYQTADGRMRYFLSTWRVGAGDLMVAQGSDKMLAVREPTQSEQRRLLDALGSPQVQIEAKCYISRANKLTGCNIRTLIPEKPGSRDAAARFLKGFRVDPDPRRSGIRLNRAAIEVSVSTEKFIPSLENRELCGLVLFCGVPTPWPQEKR